MVTEMALTALKNSDILISMSSGRSGGGGCASHWDLLTVQPALKRLANRWTVTVDARPF